MIFANIDSIVRQSLLERGLPIHFYSEALFHAKECLRQLGIDTLKIVNAANLPLNSYNAIDLPADFEDDISVCIPVGNLLQPIAKKDSLSPIRTHNATTGAFEERDNEADLDTNEFTFFGINTSYFWYWNVDAYGEPTGRYFGANGGGNLNGYKVIKERRQIQLTGSFTADDVVLLYVSDGMNIDNASQIDSKATSTILAYINWKVSDRYAMKDSPEAATFYNEKRLLKGKLNDLTLTDLRQIIRSKYTATIKN